MATRTSNDISILDDVTTQPRARSTVRAPGIVLRTSLLFLAWIGAMTPMALGALLGPTLVFIAPFLTFSGACLISGTYRWLDERAAAARLAPGETGQHLPRPEAIY